LIERIVVDSSPLIVLLKSGFAGILPEIYSEILVPDAVWNEILAGNEYDAARLLLPSLQWVKRISVEITDTTLRDSGLGRGEVEAITIALEEANTRLLVDDFAARSCAKELRIPFIGTGGLLVLAKKKSLIPSVSLALVEVQKTGLWLDHDTIELLKRKAGE
jgi:predicted nucleic acid-binding protein